jgi:hypothetical protein
MMHQLSWKTLPGLRGLSCSDFRATETAVPDCERGVAVDFADSAERDFLLSELESQFSAQRFSNNAAAFETVKAYILERMAQRRNA